MRDSVPSDTAVDFVDDVSVFDACYWPFRRVADLISGKLYQSYMKRYGLQGADSVFEARRCDAASFTLPNGRTLWVDHEWSVNAGSDLPHLDERRLLAEDAATLYDKCKEIKSSPGYNEAAERDRLIRQLSAFRDTACVLPPVFATIDTRFGGDIHAYVDALFSTAIATDKKAMRNYLRNPTLHKMCNDLGFQFVVSKMMYRVWRREGCPGGVRALQEDPLFLITKLRAEVELPH